MGKTSDDRVRQPGASLDGPRSASKDKEGGSWRWGTLDQTPHLTCTTLSRALGLPLSAAL